MNIVDVVCVPVRTGFYRDDQAAIRAGAPHNGFLYQGAPHTAGFTAIREAGVAISVMLILSDGQIALGDCAEVQYSGAGGRAGVLDVAEALAELNDTVKPLLIGRTVPGFRHLAESVDGHPLSSAVRYGVTQAILHAAALCAGITMAEVVQREYDTGITIAAVPLYAQTGDDRYANADKMILKEVDVLPHGLINEVATKLGADGGLLLGYVAWLRDRIIALRVNPGYRPQLHFDTYGTIGLAFDNDIEAITTYLAQLADAAHPFSVRIEHPIDAGSREAQIDAFARLRRSLAARQIAVELVVDEWCNTREDIDAFVAAGAADMIHVKMPDLGGINNTIEALLHVKRSGFAALCGGTCNETDISAKISAHLAMACGADQVLAKPGMGVDEGLMIVGNEMLRTLAIIRQREGAQ